MPQVEAVAAPADRGEPRVGQEPPGAGLLGPAGEDQQHRRAGGQGQADPAVAPGAAVGAQHRIAHDRDQPGQGEPVVAAGPAAGRRRLVDHPQRERRPGQQLGRAGDGAEVEVEGAQREGAGVRRDGERSGGDGEVARGPSGPSGEQQRHRPQRVEVPLDGERPGLCERVQAGQPEAAVLAGGADRRALAEHDQSPPRHLPGRGGRPGQHGVQHDAADHQAEQRGVEPHHAAPQEPAPRAMPRRTGVTTAPQQRRDDEPAQHQEDVDAHGPAVEEGDVPAGPVQRQHRTDRDRADPVEVIQSRGPRHAGVTTPA